MKRILLLLSFTSIISLSTMAQQDEAGVKVCLENYMSGEANRVEQAFHPSTTIKFIDHQSGEFKDTPIADYIARLKSSNTPSTTSNSSSGTTRPSRKIEIVSMNVEGTAAQAKLKIETEKSILYDYMNLLKVNGEWKIVSKIFHRMNK